MTQMNFYRNKKDDIVSFIYQRLFSIIYDNFDALQLMKNYRLRPNYGYKKFYINKVTGGYECSLQSLIHYILFEDQIYRDILNDHQFEECKSIIKTKPFEIYQPAGDTEEDNEAKELLDYIYNRTIFTTAQYLILVGLDVRYDFKKYLKMYPGEGL